MNYLRAFLWPKLKQGWNHLTPASGLKFTELPSGSSDSVSVELCGEPLLLWLETNLSWRQKEREIWVITEQAAKTSSHVGGQADGRQCWWFLNDTGHLTLSLWWWLAQIHDLSFHCPSMHDLSFHELYVDFILLYHTRQKWLLLKMVASQPREWTEGNMKLCGYLTSRKVFNTHRSAGSVMRSDLEIFLVNVPMKNCLGKSLFTCKNLITKISRCYCLI